MHDIGVLRDGQSTDVLKGASFEILRREDQLEAARLDGTLTAVLRIPDLRVGDELEVDVTTFASDPTLGHHEAGLLLLTPSPSPGRYHLGLSWDQGHTPHLKMTPDMAAAMLKGKRAVRAIGDTWQAIDDVQWHYDQNAAASILTISGTGTVKWDDDGDGERSLALPGGGFSPPKRRVRAQDQNRDAPFYSAPDYTCYVTTVRLPSSGQAKQWSSKSGFDTRLFGQDYYRAWELRDGSIRMVRGSRTEQAEIDAATAERDNGRIAAFDNSIGWITYNPTGNKAAVGSGEKDERSAASCAIHA